MIEPENFTRKEGGVRQTPERSWEEFSRGHTMLTVKSLAGWAGEGGPVQEIACVRVPTRSCSQNQH